MISEPLRPALSNARRVGWLMNRLNSVRADLLREALTPFGISARGLGLLMALDELPQPVSQQEISAALVLDQASVAIVAEHLQAKGLIVRHRDPRNRRRYAVELTAEGRRIFDAAWRESAEAEARMTDGLTEEEAATLRDLLQRIAAEHGII